MWSFQGPGPGTIVWSFQGAGPGTIVWSFQGAGHGTIVWSFQGPGTIVWSFQGPGTIVWCVRCFHVRGPGTMARCFPGVLLTNHLMAGTGRGAGLGFLWWRWQGGAYLIANSETI